MDLSVRIRSEVPKGNRRNKIMSEQYEVKFWYCDIDGYFKQGTQIMYAKNKNSHLQVERQFLKDFKNKYKNIRIINVTYC